MAVAYGRLTRVAIPPTGVFGTLKPAHVPFVWAHRGDTTGGARENTLEAFAAAAGAACDGVELDVRRTADNALVVHHDEIVEGVGPIPSCTVADLPDWLPLLDAALDACAGMTVNVEIKNSPLDEGWDPDGSLAAQVVEAVAGREGIVISAFHLGTVVAARNAGAGACGWLLSSKVDPVASVAVAADHGLVAVHPWHEAVTADVVTAAHTAGLAVHTWTADAPTDVARLAALGVDAIITNTPAPVIAQLRA